MTDADITAPELAVSQWFNTAEPLTLAALRGRPVLLHAFQMLCPGCVAHGTPQTQRAYELFKATDLQPSTSPTFRRYVTARPAPGPRGGPRPREAGATAMC